MSLTLVERLEARRKAQEGGDEEREAIQAEACNPEMHATTALDVLGLWSSEGPLVHEPTGLARLDELTGGGPAYGSRWYLMGAPDAGKTALLVQLADVFLGRGLAVGLLAVDEDPADILQRLMQRRGFSRAECEERASATLAAMRDRAVELDGLALYDAQWTIDRAAADLAGRALARGARAAFMADSIQTVRCEAEIGAASVREAVTSRVQAMRAAASTHRLIALATSEMGRIHYSGIKAGEGASDLAAAKESGAVEYSARVLLALKSVKGEPDLLALRIAKNKHGPRDETIGLRIDRRLQELTETELPSEEEEAEEREDAKRARAHGRNLDAAVALVEVLLASPGIATRDVVGALRTKLDKCSTDLAAAARFALATAVAVDPGERGAKYLHLDGAKLPPEVVGALPLDLRAPALAARPPDRSAPIRTDPDRSGSVATDPQPTVPLFPLRGEADRIGGIDELGDDRSESSSGSVARIGRKPKPTPSTLEACP